MPTRIMVVDNDESIRLLLTVLLTPEGWDISSFGYTGLNLAIVKELAPHLIILDLNTVQAGTGWAFLQLLKMDDNTAKIPLLIITTALNLSPEIHAYLTARHIMTMRKPFDMGVFMTAVRGCLADQVLGAPHLARALPVLVVEDNEVLAEIVVTILRMEGYQVATVTNGRLALDALSHGQYALILLDIMMPVMDGHEFLAVYPQQAAQPVPVVIYSAVPEEVMKKFPSFVVGMIAKPFEIAQLLAIVSKYAQPASGEVISS